MALRPTATRVSAGAAEVAAQNWARVGMTEPPRPDDDEWEVDVIRPNGSLVEVTIGDRLELRGLDEEFGRGGSRAADELSGRTRKRAIRAAFEVAGPGRVLSAEREPGHGVEVNVRRPTGDVFEVGLDAALRVVELEPEHPGDE